LSRVLDRRQIQVANDLGKRNPIAVACELQIGLAALGAIV
jgi:hypothetical protein